MKKYLYLISLAILMAFVSCVDENSPNTASTFSIQQKLLANKASSNKSTPNNTLPGNFEFSSVLIGVSKIKFEKEFKEDNVEVDEEIAYKGAFTFDVLAGTSEPDLPGMQMEVGTYHELEIEIDDVLTSGNSVEVIGVYTEGGIAYPFEFTSTMDEKFEIENENGIVLTINEAVNFVLYLQIESLFKGVNFSESTVDNDGVIKFNSNSNKEMASIIEDNFEDIMDFDDDNHGEHDDDNDDNHSGS